MKIEVYARDIIVVYNDRFGYDEHEQQELIRWFCQNKPQMIRDIVCEECPEHCPTIDTNKHQTEE